MRLKVDSRALQLLFCTDTHILCECVCVCVWSYYSVCGSDNSLRAVISLQLGPSLDTVRLLAKKEREVKSWSPFTASNLLSM